MKRTNVIYGSILLIVCLLLLYFSPDLTSMLFIGAMVLVLFLGFDLGINKTLNFCSGFKNAVKKMGDMDKIAADDSWIYIKHVDSLFGFRIMDLMFAKYIKKVESAKNRNSMILPDVEDYINEYLVSLKTNKNFAAIIPSTLTGLGILGTFYGLVSGLGNIRFSSVDVVVDSISLLVSGIDTAFYSSIAGVTLSLIFEVMNKLSWNNMVETMVDFYDRFHTKVIASDKEQMESIQQEVYKKVLADLDEKQ